MDGREALPPDAGQFLLAVARASIAGQLNVPDPEPEVQAMWDRRSTPSWAEEERATFVTLTDGGRLRGCIGSLVAHRPVVLDVHHNARAAAFSDPRFAPLSLAEYPRVRVQVSLLSEPTPLAFAGEADAVGQLRPGIDGVTLTASGRRGTFLPQVWDELPDRAEFWRSLKRKAGLPVTYWGPDVRIERYTVRSWSQ